MSKKVKISDMQSDPNNFNRHTERGKELLNMSIDKVGVIESVTVSSDGVVISGNARKAAMDAKMGEEDAIIVKTDGKKPIILQRVDIQSGTKEFYEAAILANTVSKHNLDLDIAKIEEVAVNEHGIEVEELGVQPLRNIVGNEYSGERDVNNEDYVIVYLSKRHIGLLNDLMEKMDVASHSDVVLKLIEGR